MEPGSAAPALQWVLAMLLCRAQLCSHAAASPCARTELARPPMATSAPCSALPAAQAERAAGIWLTLPGRVPVLPWDGPGHPPAPFPAQVGIAGVWDRKARSSPGNRVPGSTWGLTPASALCLCDHARWAWPHTCCLCPQPKGQGAPRGWGSTGTSQPGTPLVSGGEEEEALFPCALPEPGWWVLPVGRHCPGSPRHPQSAAGSTSPLPRGG